MTREFDAATGLGASGDPDADRRLAEHFGMTVRQVREFDPQTLDVTRACRFLGLPLKRFDTLAAQSEDRGRWATSIARQKKDLIETFPAAGVELKEMLEAIRKFALRKCLNPDGPAQLHGAKTGRGDVTKYLSLVGGAVAAILLVGGLFVVLMPTRGKPQSEGDAGAKASAEQPVVKGNVDRPTTSAPPAKPDAGAKAPAEPDNGFTPLFNGKDLFGWLPLGPKEANAWKVQDGVLVGQSEKWASLRSVRADYGDFHLAVEAMVSGGGGGSVRFRCPLEGKPGPFYAQIGAEGRWQTGSLLQKVMPALHGPWYILAEVPSAAAPANTWFTLDVIAIGDRVTLKVNGKTTADVRKADGQRSGYLMLYPEKGSGIHFRKIEIKELPAGKEE